MTEIAFKKKRPKNLALMTIRFPLNSYLSILHRVSGAALFLFIPLLLCLLQMSLSSPESFAVMKGWIANPLVKLILFGLIWAYAHHFCAGIRFLLLDMHKGVELESARLSTKIVFAVSIPLAIVIAGVLLW